MKFITPLISAFLMLFSLSLLAQENVASRPTFVGTANSVEYVTPMSSRPQDLLKVDQTPREAKDKKSIANQVVMGQDPQTQDDYFVRNKHEMEQSVTRTPASLVFDTYSSNSQPTDPSLAVGPNHVIVVYNTGFMIYDKNGNVLQGETSPNPAIFPAGGCCDLTASYDNAADRWVLSFLNGAGAGAQIAVSDGPNPLTAGWYIYNISAINDYQKLSVWSDGYYMTDNTSSSNKVWALERDAMLAGNAGAKVVGFSLPGIVTSGFFSPQVLNVTDNNLPAAGGATIVYMQDDAWSGVTTDHIKVWTLDMDWNTTSNSVMSAFSQINTTPFISVFDNGSFSNLTQPGGGSAIDALQATIMNQAQFRKFATYNSALFNFVVDADAGTGELAAVRWMELRQSGDNQPWSLYQEGTYTAPDGRHAWNASLAMDGQGNIGMGYTSMSGPTTSSTVRVSSYFTSRLSNDPIGTMSGAEELIANGNGNFSGTRYGDYSKIDVDPSDDSSFYFITEYINNGRKGVVGKFEVTPPVPDFEDPTDPTNLVASNITSNSAVLSWTASTDNIGVSQYNVSIDGIVVGSTSNTSYTATGLSPLTAYNASVVAQDAAGNTSEAATTSFTTIDGPAAEYCDSMSTNTDDEFISNVTLNTINNTTGASFYTDYSQTISTDLTEGETYDIIVTPTWTGTIYSEGYAAWIDYNNDGDFVDAGELVWSKAPSQDTPNTGTFTVPAGTALTSVRLRVSLKYNAIPTPCETFTYGEVEDYTVNLVSDDADTEAPTIPLNLVASNETSSTVDLSWDASSDNVGVTGYEIFMDGLSIGTVTGTTSTVTDLFESTSYVFTVTAFDAVGNASAISNAANATTTGGGGLIAGYYFETGLEGWSDPGENCVRVNWGARSYEGQRSIRIRNGTETSLSESPLLDFTGNNTISIEFHTYANSMESGETFYLELLSNGVYEAIGTYVSDIDFTNGGFFTDTVFISSLDYDFSNDNRIRFRNDANANNDQIYFDQVIINGDGMNVPTPPLMLSAHNVGPTSVDLNWMASIDLNANGQNGIVTYDVYQDNVFIASTAQLDYSVMNLVVDTTYSFYIVARDEDNNMSFASNSVTVTTQDFGPVLIAGYYFETGLEGWSDPGENCQRVNWGARSFEGQRSIRIRNGTATSLSESPLLDLSGVNNISIEFHTYSNSMEGGETFYLELLNNGVYEVIGTYVSGVDFSNGGFFTDTVFVNNLDYDFSNDNRIRFRNAGNTNNDQIYFDQVIILGDNAVAKTVGPNVIDTQENVATFTANALGKIRLYPNPAESELNISIVDDSFDSLEIYSTSGQLVRSVSTLSNRMTLDISSLTSGMYFVRFASNGFVITKRFVKK